MHLLVNTQAIFLHLQLNDRAHDQRQGLVYNVLYFGSLLPNTMAALKLKTVRGKLYTVCLRTPTHPEQKVTGTGECGSTVHTEEMADAPL